MAQCRPGSQTMRIFAKCLLLAFCLKRHHDDEQTFPDQLEQQPATVVHIAQPEPDDVQPHGVNDETQPDVETLAKDTLRTAESPNDAATTAMRGSHSPARLEEISICADVHESGKRAGCESPLVASKACGCHSGERCSGVVIKDEIEVVADVEVDVDVEPGNGAPSYFVF